MPALLPSLDLQHLWFRVAGKRLTTLALVPVEDDVSTLAIAEGLARVAAEQPKSRVLIVNASLSRCRPPRLEPVHADVVLDGLRGTFHEQVVPQCDYVDFSSLHLEDAERALTLAPQLIDFLAAEGKSYTTALFAVDSPLSQTRGIPLLRSLEGVVVAISLGRTRFATARQLIDLIGPDRVAGAVALK